jgi:hypothetical protein
MITGDQLLAHAFGDYVLQSDWCANEKTKKSVAALVHVLLYMIPFLFITQSIPALFIIVSTHFVIDRWRLARYVCWFKNFLSPKITCHCGRWFCGGHPDGEQGRVWWRPWEECKATGYHKSVPDFMAVWLLIFADNCLHILINGLAIMYLG